MKSSVVNQAEVLDMSSGEHSSRPRIEGVSTVMLLDGPRIVEAFLSVWSAVLNFVSILLSSRGANAQSSFVHGEGVEL